MKIKYTIKTFSYKGYKVGDYYENQKIISVPGDPHWIYWRDKEKLVGNDGLLVETDIEHLKERGLWVGWELNY